MTPRERHDMKYIVATAGVVILSPCCCLSGGGGLADRLSEKSNAPPVCTRRKRRAASTEEVPDRVEASMVAPGELRQPHRSAITRIVSSDAKATASVVSDVLLPHEPQLVQRDHRQRGRRQVHLLRWR